MTKVAKLIDVSLTVRVIVEDDLSETDDLHSLVQGISADLFEE